MKLQFTKLSGNGNDFVLLERPGVDLTPELIQRLCDRHFGVGADGVLVAESSTEADVKMTIYNADGTCADMCANGARCLGDYYHRKMANPKREQYVIQTAKSLYPILLKNNAFALQMTEKKDIEKYDLRFIEAPFIKKTFFINTGVPHVVLEVDNVEEVDLLSWGKKIRFHETFPDGTNVNFFHRLPGTQHGRVRTYERGVENETFSCGTGLTAVAWACHQFYGWKNEMKFHTKGGLHTLTLTDNDELFLQGEVTWCFEGEFEWR